MTKEIIYYALKAQSEDHNCIAVLQGRDNKDVEKQALQNALEEHFDSECVFAMPELERAQYGKICEVEIKIMEEGFSGENYQTEIIEIEQTWLY